MNEKTLKALGNASVAIEEARWTATMQEDHALASVLLAMRVLVERCDRRELNAEQERTMKECAEQLREIAWNLSADLDRQARF